MFDDFSCLYWILQKFIRLKRWWILTWTAFYWFNDVFGGWHWALTDVPQTNTSSRLKNIFIKTRVSTSYLTPRRPIIELRARCFFCLFFFCLLARLSPNLLQGYNSIVSVLHEMRDRVPSKGRHLWPFRTRHSYFSFFRSPLFSYLDVLSTFPGTSSMKPLHDQYERICLFSLFADTNNYDFSFFSLSTNFFMYFSVTISFSIQEIIDHFL